MRFVFAILALAIVGISAAGAEGLRRHSSPGVRIAPLVIYDYQPGVVVRAYWLAPWRQRHYYPTTGERPDVGREEDLTNGAGSPPEPAESFQRSWSTSSAFLPEQVRRRPAPDDAPPAEPKFPAPLK